MKAYILSGLLFFAVALCEAQEAMTDSLNFEIYLAKGFRGRTRDSVAYYFNKAERLAITPYRQVRFNRWKGNWLTPQKQFRDSAAYFFNQNMSRPLPENESDAYYVEITESHYSYDYLMKNYVDRKEVIALLKEGIDILVSRDIEHEIVGMCYQSIGMNNWFLQNFSEAFEWYKKALSYARDHGYSDAQVRATYQLATGYQHQRKLDLALEYYKYFLVYVEKYFNQNHAPYLQAMKSIGLVFAEDGKLDSAEYYYQKGLDFIASGVMRNPAEGVYHRHLILNNLASVQMRKKDFKAAANSYTEVLDYNSARYGRNSVQLMRTLLGLGDLHRRTEEFDKCEGYYQRALAIGKIHDYDVHRCYNRLGYMFTVMKEWDRSYSYYDSAIEVNSKAYNNDQLAYEYPVHLFNSLKGKSDVEKSRESVDIDRIESIYSQLKDVVNFFQTNTNSQTIFRLIPPVLSNLYEAYSREYDIAPDQKWLDRLWEISEMNKATKLRNELKGEYSLNFSIPKELLARQKALKDSINQAIGKVKPGVFDTTIFNLKQQYNEFMVRLEEDFPRYHSLKNEKYFIPLSVKQASLQEGEVLLSFFEGVDSVYLMTIGSDVISRHKVDKKEVTTWIDRHNKAIFGQDTKDVIRASEKFKEFFGLGYTNHSNIKKLHIVPDGVIWNLNFSAITDQEGEQVVFLGNQKSITYHDFSGEPEHKLGAGSRNILAFSYNQKDDVVPDSKRIALRNLNASLPGTSEEVASISRLWKGDYFYANQANESTFKEEGSGYGILHLAVHGYQDENSPENSYLKFAAADSLNDGKLHAYEIYNLDLNAELAVLSACHSGQGKIVAGEGMVSLGRAFAYAGVKSLLISRWEVSDYSAPFLMKYFYSGLKKGMRKSEALRYAQKAYLENHSDDLTASPFYWSSFYVLGDDSAIFKDASVGSWTLVWALSIVIVAILSLRTKRMRV